MHHFHEIDHFPPIVMVIHSHSLMRIRMLFALASSQIRRTEFGHIKPKQGLFQSRDRQLTYRS